MPEPESTSPPSEQPIMAFFDVDNTLMRGTSLFQLGREAWRKHVIGVRDIARFAWHQFRFIAVGENDDHLATAQERALGLVGGHTEADVAALAEGIWDRRISKRLYPETVQLARDHIARGDQVWLVSATPREIGTQIAHHLGLTGALGTVVESRDGVYTGGLIGHVLHKEHKAEAVRALAERAGADLADCWAYSDSRNDIPLLELVGHPTVVNPDAALTRHAEAKGWPVLRPTAASIRDAERRLRRETKKRPA